MSPTNNDEDYDERPLVSDLMLKYSKEIESVRNKIKDEELYKKDAGNNNAKRRYDDIWILRYVLSHHKNINGASEAAIQTMIFREEKKLNDDVAGDIRHRIQNYGDIHDQKQFKSMAASNNNEEPLPGWEKANKCCGENALFRTQPDPNRGILFVTDPSRVDMDLVLETVSQDELVEAFLYANECVFQVLDDVTRRTGKLTKCCKIVDLGNMQLSKMNKKYQRADDTAKKALESYYPQLLGAILIVNSPPWISTVWKLSKFLFSKSVINKVDFVPVTKKEKPSSSTKSSSKKHLKPFLKYISEEHLPEKYGGKNKTWPMECFGRVYQKQMLAK